jgi:glycosyltransferase involved in cell wall biosynthesis
METPLRICVVVPVYNHAGTVQRVVRESQRAFPVIVVDDGSTDQGPTLLAREKGITLVTLPVNRGKAAALKAGFAEADALDFTHAITIDADGQHPTDALAKFATACRQQPEALIIGIRDLKAAGAPAVRRLSNALSSFWFRFETGVRLSDTQCGYRVYPLATVQRLHVKSDRYAYELEILVKAAWAGIPLRSQPVLADYAAATSRLSHFAPLRDFVRISGLHARLAIQALCVPAPRRRMWATKD